MKNPIRILAALTMIAALAIPYGCKDDDDPAAPLELSTITVGGADLNGATSPVGVATDAAIDIDFTTTVDATTATASNIKLMRDYDDADVPVTINVDGTKVTVTPDDALSAGNIYVLTVSEGVKSDRGESFTAITRNFTTAGFFSLPGQAAHWSFESNGDDEFGVYNSNNEIDVTFVDGRNAGSGKAASFNGTTSIIEVPNGDDFLETGSLTLSFWVKPDATNEHGHFVIGLAGFLGFQYEIPMDMSSAKLAARYELSTGGSDGEDLWWNGEAGSYVGWTLSKDVGGAAGVQAIFAEWTHVVCTFNADTKIGTMYLNGEKVKEFDFKLYDNVKANAVKMVYEGNTEAPGNNLAFGFVQSSSAENRSLADGWAAYENEDNNHFKGQLDDVRIWTKAITADEVSLIYNSEK